MRLIHLLLRYLCKEFVGYQWVLGVTYEKDNLLQLTEYI